MTLSLSLFKNGVHSEAVHFSVNSDAATVLGRSELQTCTRYSRLLRIRSFGKSYAQKLLHGRHKNALQFFYRKESSKLVGVLLRKHVSPSLPSFPKQETSCKGTRKSLCPQDFMDQKFQSQVLYKKYCSLSACVLLTGGQCAAFHERNNKIAFPMSANG